MSALPREIQKVVDEADRIAKEIQGAGEPTDAPVEETEQAEDTQQGNAPQDVSFGAETIEAEEVDTGEKGTEEEEQPTAQGEEADDYKALEHRHKTLQGMFNSEKRKNEELSTRVDALEGMLAELQKVRTDAEQKDQATEEEVKQSLAKKGLSPEEIEDYGADLIDVVKRAAREEFMPEIENLRKENADLKNQLSGVGTQVERNERDKIYAKLDQDIPNWRELNVDQAFHTWLGQMDVYAGSPRKALLNEAFQANDTNRVVSFFKGYLEEVAALERAAGKETTQSTPSRNGKGKVDLETLAAPGTGHSGSADTNPNQGRSWKESEIGAFYEAARRGKYKGREAEYKKVEQQIQTALREGRVLPGQ